MFAAMFRNFFSPTAQSSTPGQQGSTKKVPGDGLNSISSTSLFQSGSSDDFINETLHTSINSQSSLVKPRDILNKPRSSSFTTNQNSPGLGSLQTNTSLQIPSIQNEDDIFEAVDVVKNLLRNIGKVQKHLKEGTASSFKICFQDDDMEKVQHFLSSLELQDATSYQTDSPHLSISDKASSSQNSATSREKKISKTRDIVDELQKETQKILTTFQDIKAKIEQENDSFFTGTQQLDTKTLDLTASHVKSLRQINEFLKVFKAIL